MKSNTCFGRNQKPLSEFYSKQEAQQSADYENNYRNANLMPYNCTYCHQWHLSPKDRHTENITCLCTDSTGSAKAAYTTENDAIRRANIIVRENNVGISIYKCRYGYGWHLTKTKKYR